MTQLGYFGTPHKSQAAYVGSRRKRLFSHKQSFRDEMPAKLLGLIALGAGSVALSHAHAKTQLGVGSQSRAPVGWVVVGCSNPGSQQDIAKTPIIKNTTATPIPRGKSLSWKASDGDTGSVTLGQDLAPGDSVKGAGKPAATYTCTARFHAGPPDLVVIGANLTTGVAAIVKNTNPWIDAGPSVVRFELLKCSDNSILFTTRSGPQSIAAGSTQKFTPVSKKPAKRPRSHWRITTDFDKRVAESNEDNNVWTNQLVCGR